MKLQMSGAARARIAHVALSMRELSPSEWMIMSMISLLLIRLMRFVPHVDSITSTAFRRAGLKSTFRNSFANVERKSKVCSPYLKLWIEQIIRRKFIPPSHSNWDRSVNTLLISWELKWSEKEFKCKWMESIRYLIIFKNTQMKIYNKRLDMLF